MALTINIENLKLNSGAHASVSADSPEEVHRALNYLVAIGQLGVQPAVQTVPAPVSGEPDNPVQTSPGPAETPPPVKLDDPADTPVVGAETAKPAKPKRPTKAEKEAAAKELADIEAARAAEAGDTPEPEPEQAVLVKATAEDAAAAITEVANVKGLAAAKALLTVFKVKRAGELDPSQFESFIKEATALIAPADEEATDEDPADIL
jgi:hypothetical protein